MTTEGVVMIVILSLALLKTIQAKNYFSELISLKRQFTSKSNIETIVFFAFTLILGLVSSKYIIGLLLINAIMWGVFHVFLKSLKYNFLAWLSLIIFGFYLYATNITFDKIPQTEIWYYSLFSWEISLLFVLVYDTIGKYVKVLPTVIVWLAYFILLLIPFVFIAYRYSFDVPINVNQLNAIFQTNFHEATEFVSMFVSPLWLIIVVLMTVGLLSILILQEFTSKKSIKRKTFFYITVGLLLFANINVLQTLKLPTFIIDSTQSYLKELATFKKELERRKLGDIKFRASKKEKKELYVIIIGESLNKNHMSLYGYPRITNPKLDKLYKDGSIIKFEEVFSNHTHTIPVLTKAFTTSNQLNKASYFYSLSILDIFEEADFNTYWLSNQISYGEWDNPVSVLADRADIKYSINSNIGLVNKTVFYDEMLVKKLEKILSDGITENTAIFIHLMGSHGEFKNRYPDDYKYFTGALNKKIYGSKNYWSENINEYDNSILYNDNVVSGIISGLQKMDGVSACLYFSDHGEDVLANKGHNSGNFTFPMTQIPMIMWFSDAYKNSFDEKYNALKNHTQELFSTDLIYDMLIGLTGISTDQYNAEHDLFSESYQLPIQDCFTLDGQRKYSEKENVFYHQRRNSFILDSLNMLSRVFPHRVNSIGKLKEIFYNGHTSFEVDLIFRQGMEMDYFEVGHDDTSLSGMKLEELLSYTNNIPFEKIWLDIKNLNDKNISAIIKHLTKLDQKFNIRKKAIVESSTTSISFSNIAKLGFQTSYYLPTDIKNLDPKMRSIKANEIASQINKQAVKAISFDIALYPFVKQNLEKMIQSDIVYHLWDLSLKLKDAEFKKVLLDKNYYIDNRVKSILVKYHSNYEL